MPRNDKERVPRDNKGKTPPNDTFREAQPPKIDHPSCHHHLYPLPSGERGYELRSQGHLGLGNSHIYVELGAISFPLSMSVDIPNKGRPKVCHVRHISADHHRREPVWDIWDKRFSIYDSYHRFYTTLHTPTAKSSSDMP